MKIELTFWQSREGVVLDAEVFENIELDKTYTCDLEGILDTGQVVTFTVAVKVNE